MTLLPTPPPPEGAGGRPVLKGINSTGGADSFDMGGDGRYSSLNRYTTRDAIGLTLNYFGSDYTAINGMPFPGYSGFLSNLSAGTYRPLYNGNISSSSVYQKKFEDEPGGPLIFYNYKYDQLNRLTAQDTYNGFLADQNKWDNMRSMGETAKERVAYDANGNIQRYLRKSMQGGIMDSLKYHYYANTNQLRRITDSVPADAYVHNGGFIVDIDNQADSNYIYDSIGNLIRDKQENIDSIKWNVYGKIAEIFRRATDTVPASNIKYTYDAMGNRIGQVVTSGGTKYYTWYVRDAQGNILSTYTADGNATNLESLQLNQGEKFLYGSSRLGLITVKESVDGGPDYTPNYEGRAFMFGRGYRQYELTNHLGNVLATVSDRKFGVSSAGSSLIDHYEPHIVTAQDYYPFGMLSRVNLNGKSYTFGFNGQMMNNDVKGGLGNSYTAQYWEYDSRIGRRWNLDPRPTAGISEYSTFNNSPILNSDPLGDTTSPRSSFGQKGPIDLAKYKPGALPYEGNVLNRANAVVNNWIMAPIGHLAINAVDGIGNPGWTLTNIKDGIVGGLQSLIEWDRTHPDKVAGVSEVLGGAVSYAKENWNNPEAHLQVATMGWGVFGGGALGSNLGKGSTFSSVTRTGTSLETTDNIALSLNEHLFDFAKATKAKDYKQFTFGSFNPTEIAAAIENPSNRIHFNLQGFSMKNYTKYAKNPIAPDPALRNVTNWELFTLKNAPGALDRTIFYKFKKGSYVPVKKPF